ncbi:NACHT domain-containing protein [Anabaena sp. CCY 9910]|uniref:NACHT domain-containing protein n=1 Tax=Anabaena sp. CCY 9910 TaxID=3103870 RepID=UPI0039E17A14
MPDAEEPKQVNNNDLRNAQFGGGFINAENVNAGRIGGDILNFFFGQQTTLAGNPARPKNERILLAAVKEEVSARLRQSLHSAVLINLGKESQPQQVKRPWDAEIKIGLKPAEPLPDKTTILEVFDSQEIAGKLLILGAPGSGKTTTQLELAQELVKRAEEQPDYPVPVLFNLSSWKDDRQSITDWLVAELKSKYGVSTKLGQEWVGNKQLLPLVDGLDELEPQRQELCVHAINQFLAGENRPLYLVVCSRIEEYSNYATQLQLNGAIYLQPLTNKQICDYLTAINCIELWSTISNDLDLLELVKTPLLLSITVLASQEISVEEWQHLTSTADRLQYLLDTYVGRMLIRSIKSRAYLKNKTPNAREMRMCLVWLAQQLQGESKSEFLIEEMQPNWLNTTQKFIYFLSIVLIIWLLSLTFILGSIVFYFILFSFYQNNITKSVSQFEGEYRSQFFIAIAPFLGLLISVLYGLFLGINCGISKRIRTIEIINFSYNKAKYKLLSDLSVFIILLWFIIILIGNFIGGSLGGTALGISSLLIFVLMAGLNISEISTKKIPNQGIRKSAINAAFFGICGVLISPLVVGFSGGHSVGWSIGLIFLPSLPLVFCFSGGAKSLIQHFTLRLILYFNGYIPWNYARFLDYCTERMLLQRVGGRYRFIHKLLQDHFAQMEFRRD